jgi:hypothetical protein
MNFKLKTLLFILLLFPVILYSQSNNFWKKTKINDVPSKDIVKYSANIESPVYYELDKSSLSEFISKAPDRFSRAKSNVILDIPNSKGEEDRFEIFSTQTMSPELSAKFPNIKSYVGQNILNKNHKLRITITPSGFFAMTLGSKYGQTYINPYSKNSNKYVVFNKSQITNTKENLVCEFVNEKDLSQDIPIVPNLIDDNILRKYRLGVATTVEYSQFHLSNAGVPSGASDQVKKNAVLSAIVVSIDRVNEIYERDLGITLELIPNNEDVIFLGNSGSDPYSNNSGFSMLNQNQSVFNSTIGSSNYDIGHVYSTGGGGIASLGSVCSSFSKARGVTGQSSPIGDTFDVDYVAHEMGHQFGANHTQNNNCNRNNATAVEPGSASTIMGYAGICSPNVQNNSDAMFHYISILEIANFIQNGGGSNCSENLNTLNSEPILQNLPNYTIPKNTAFALTISATDADGDDLTYSWEQFDNESAPMPPRANSDKGPNFRAFLPSDSPTRFFPGMNTLLSNNYSSTWEVLPNVSRTMEFAVVVRDNNILGGQVSTQTTTVSVNSSAGPFRVTSQQGSNVTWNANSTKNITWNVANTNNPSGVNSQFVDIVLSLDNGQNFDQVLISNTPNDGSEQITVPNSSTQNARLMVRSSDNIFFDINEANIEITNSGVVCNSPTNLNISNITTSTVQFSWTLANPSPANGYEWVVMDSGISPNLSNSVDSGAVNAGTSSILANGLDPDSDYDIYVRSRCESDEQSNWSNKVSFTTLPVASSCVPPSGLNTNNITTTGVEINWTESESLPANGYQWGIVNAGVAPAISNLLMSGANGLGNLSTNIQGLEPNTSYDFYIRSRCSGGDLSGLNSISFTTSDDVINDPCLKPENLNVIEVSSTTVNFGWTAPESLPLNGYEWIVVNSGSTPDISINVDNGTVGADVLSATSTALNPDTNYDIYVRSNCNNSEESEWSVKASFSTAPVSSACLPPLDLSAENITTNSLSINWSAPSNLPSRGYQWGVVDSGDSPVQSNLIVFGTGNQGSLNANVTGLSPNTSYDFYIRGNCGGGKFSNFQSLSFTTLAEDFDLVYCEASGDGANNSDEFEKIDNVIFNTINNSSTSNAGYQDFTSISTTVQKGVNYTINISSPDISFADNQILVWIDFNQDSDFEDVGEEVFVSATGTSPWSGNILIPQSALLGETTMRIRLHDTQFGPNSSPCGNSDYGEVEDYSINISNSSSASSRYNSSTDIENFGADFVLFPNPTSNGLFNIKTYDLNNNTVDVIVNNMLGQQVLSQNLKVRSNGEINIDASSLNSGVYLIVLRYNDNIFTEKLIIR